MIAGHWRSRPGHRWIGEIDMGVGSWVGVGIAIALVVLSIGFRVVRSVIDLRTDANKDWLNSYVDGRINSGKKPFDPTKL
jgi:hypothetical protein